MNTWKQLFLISILFTLTKWGALYAAMTSHYYYAFALLGFFILMIIYLVFLFFKEILSYEYDWTDKEIAKMNEDTENSK